MDTVQVIHKKKKEIYKIYEQITTSPTLPEHATPTQIIFDTSMYPISMHLSHSQSHTQHTTTVFE